MATSGITEAQAELIRSLPQSEIPAKLRCAICSKLAVNPFRLPCCEQAICETCQSTLPPSCPVCEHSPLSSDDCKPHKSLRTTIKVFLRTAEKKRETSRSKDTPPVTPVDPTPTPTAASAPPPAPAPVVTDTPVVANGDVPQEEPQSAVEATPAEPTQVVADGHEAGKSPDAEATVDQEEQKNAGPEDEGNPTVDGEEPAKAEDDDAENTEMVPTDANQQAAQGFPGTLPVTGFGGVGLDPMQMQMQMQMMAMNGMAPGGFPNFAMMGMPNMNMDPTMMQMYGGLQDMNGMNMMNMMSSGMGGYGDEANNNWNGQQTWNVGQ